MPNRCPQCGTEQPTDAVRCNVCGGTINGDQDPAALLDSRDILGYSVYVIGLLLLALGIPCVVGLLCLLISR